MIEDMTMNRYQNEAFLTAQYPEAGEGTVGAVIYGGLAVAGEGGEIANQVKKILRDDGGVLTESRRQKIYEEAQGCLWELSALIRELGYTLEEAGNANLRKLRDRQARGVIKGDGDNR